MWALVAVGGTIVGLVTAHAADQVFTQQRAERIPVRTVLLNEVPRTPAAGRGRDPASAHVRRTSSDGSAHQGMTLVSTGRKAGSTVRIWLDAQGKLSTQPPTPTRAAVEAGLLGTVAALALSAVVVRRRKQRAVLPRPTAHRAVGQGVEPGRPTVGAQDQLTHEGPNPARYPGLRLSSRPLRMAGSGRVPAACGTASSGVDSRAVE
ncbi:Rv1733c family protein [Streptomyces gilvus]|uniref:Rv1733c family protein n=1 Tax=Streptomyces gilvus TaxID=2920937 RepID=UPI003F912514